MLQALMGGLINVNHSRGAFAGDSAGQIDRVAPEVVDEFAPADDAGHHRPGGDTDADVEVFEIHRKVAMQQVAHLGGQIGDCSGVVRP